MKHFIQFLILTFSSFLFIPATIHAQEDINLEQIDPSLTSLTTATSTGVAGSFFNLFFVVAVTTALIFLLIGGISYITSAGDKDNLAKAAHKIRVSLIGLCLTLLVYLTVRLISIVLTVNLLCVELPIIGQSIGGNCPAVQGFPAPSGGTGGGTGDTGTGDTTTPVTGPCPCANSLCASVGSIGYLAGGADANRCFECTTAGWVEDPSITNCPAISCTNSCSP